MDGSGGVEVPMDLFHLGFLLVILMVFITGIVILVAVTGVCCFDWLGTKETLRNSNSTGQKAQIRDERVGLENRRNEEMRRQWLTDVPPPYEILFPTTTPDPSTMTSLNPPHPIVQYV